MPSPLSLGRPPRCKITVVATQFEARVVGDLDCDWNQAVFTRILNAAPNGGEIYPMRAMRVVNEVE